MIKQLILKKKCSTVIFDKWKGKWGILLYIYKFGLLIQGLAKIVKMIIEMSGFWVLIIGYLEHVVLTSI